MIEGSNIVDGELVDQAQPAGKPVERKRKAQEGLVAGTWAGSVFTAALVQPETPITELSKMIAWVKKTYETDGGKFEFIRKVPGALTLAQQMVFSSEFVR